MARLAQIGIVALLAISIATLPCPSCFEPQAPAKSELPSSDHACCHKKSSPSPVETSQEKTPACGWMPADNGQPEARTDVAKNLEVFALLDAEATVFSHYVDIAQTVADSSPGSEPAAPPTIAVSLRC